jgi:hypothetical protein
MKTFLVDWGENANGGRFALVQAASMEKAFWDADSIGSPFSISELRIPKDTDGIRYVESTFQQSNTRGRYYLSAEISSKDGNLSMK